MTFDEQDWMDGFDSWEEVWSVLHDDWVRVVDDAQRLQLHWDGHELSIVEMDRRLRARQRRSLHRMGFRPLTAAHVTLWHWDVRDALRRIDLRDFSTPFEKVFDACDPATRQQRIEQLRTRHARAHLLTEQTLRVVREVFCSQPQDLSVNVLREREWWEDEEDVELPTG